MYAMNSQPKNNKTNEVLYCVVNIPWGNCMIFSNLVFRPRNSDIACPHLATWEKCWSSRALTALRRQQHDCSEDRSTHGSFHFWGRCAVASLPSRLPPFAEDGHPTPEKAGKISPWPVQVRGVASEPEHPATCFSKPSDVPGTPQRPHWPSACLLLVCLRFF